MRYIGAAGFECPALREEAALALARGGTGDARHTAGLHHGRAQRGGLKLPRDLDARGGLALPAPWSGPFRGLAAGPPQGWAVRLLDIQAEANREDVITADQDGADILVTPDGRVGRGVLHLGDGIHGAPTCGVLGSLQDHVDGLSLPGREGAPPCLSLLAEHRLGVPPRHYADVVEAGPGGRRVQRPLQAGDMPPSPPTGDGEDQQAKVAERIPVQRPLQGVKKVGKARGHAYEAEHGAILLTPPACGRWVRS
jgi:hypothetical protein